MASYDINFSATLHATSGNVTAGLVVCPNAASTAYVVATTANRALSGRMGGVALTAAAPGDTCVVQYSGEVPASITGLGAGAIAAVRVSTTGTLERIVSIPPDPSDNDVNMGDCDALGALTLSRVSYVNPSAGGGSTITWATDLVGSVDASQVVSGLTGASNKTVVRATSRAIEWATATTTPSLSQEALAGATGATLTVQAQDATTTGGTLVLTSGSGVTAGDVSIRTGGAVALGISAPVINVIPPTLQWSAAGSPVLITHTTTGAATGSSLTVQAQDALTTGGALALTTGTGGTVAGTISLQTGGTNRVTISPTIVNVTGTVPLTFGTAPATTGRVRLPNGAGNGVNLRNSIDSGNYIGIQVAVDTIQVGDYSTDAMIVVTSSGGRLDLRTGASANSFSITSTQILTGKPILGDVSETSPWAVHGAVNIPIAVNTARTETAANLAYSRLNYTAGGISAAVDVTMYTPSSLAGYYEKTIRNDTGFTLTFYISDPTINIAVATGKTAILGFDSVGVRRVTADT